MTWSGRIGPLFTDLYELTMAASYYHHNIFKPATFSLFVRKLPPHRGFLVAAGLEDALRELVNFHFNEDELAYLASTDLFADTFLAYLQSFSFNGEVYAMPEGTIFFPDEPILEVTASVIEAQLVETFLLNTLGFQTMIASKAARCVHAAAGRPLIDFALRRTHGQDAGLKVARATYLGGFSGTSNVLAGQRYGIPISGTMAHSYIGAFEDEQAAFEAYAATFPDKAVFLIDTYDTLEGARTAAVVARQMLAAGHRLVGVRLDSGDMVALSCGVRRILDEAGLADVKIYASSGFDEFGIAQVLTQGAAIDAFGVGTKAGVSADAPYLDIVYKLVRFGERDVRKLSPGKVTLAGPKQVCRLIDPAGRFSNDVIGLRDEAIAGSRPLLKRVMVKGQLDHPLPDLAAARDRCQASLKALPQAHKALQAKSAFPVAVSPGLQALQARID